MLGSPGCARPDGTFLRVQAGPQTSALPSPGTSPWDRFGHLGATVNTDEREEMRSKKQKRAAEKSRSRHELEKRESILRGQLTKTEKALKKAKNRADRWRKEAQSQKRSALRARARLEKLKQKRHAAGPTRKPMQAGAPGEGSAPGRPRVEPVSVESVMRPNETWSVAQLRAEARTRGLTGMSNKTKAQLLTALS